jgi:hypothetical protein
MENSQGSSSFSLGQQRLITSELAPITVVNQDGLSCSFFGIRPPTYFIGTDANNDEFLVNTFASDEKPSVGDFNTQITVSKYQSFRISISIYRRTVTGPLFNWGIKLELSFFIPNKDLDKGEKEGDDIKTLAIKQVLSGEKAETEPAGQTTVSKEDGLIEVIKTDTGVWYKFITVVYSVYSNIRSSDKPGFGGAVEKNFSMNEIKGINNTRTGMNYEQAEIYYNQMQSHMAALAREPEAFANGSSTTVDLRNSCSAFCLAGL